MAIFKNSRYTRTPLYNHSGEITFRRRKRFTFNPKNFTYHIFSEGDTLDGLAFKYYGDTQLWWIILEANTTYKSVLDIPSGTALALPSVEEVIKCLK